MNGFQKGLAISSIKKLRNRPFTIKEAKARDYAEIENLEKGGPIAMADYTILNPEDLKFLMKQVKVIYEESENNN